MTRCVPCWRAEQLAKAWDQSPEKARLVERIRELEREREALRAQLANVTALLPDDRTLRRLIQCAHPDRHQNSEASKLAMQWLNQVRRLTDRRVTT
ncbi:hypothetical protein LMG31841_02939 [Paraburkholderia saeva]|uniref:Uncharacterized protein n=2 Tax=Paraburkholderia saeva TaxID=2777537 RepID=A0A9N8RXZ2_9BURK|nr:hypothetical protein LMG31841_02939 [Paraburkholderia saeva]